MPFVFGEIDSREQNPWAYDATNDLPKSHGLYLAAAGLVTTDTAKFSALAAGALGSGRTTIFGTTPTGKKTYIVAVTFAAEGGPGTCEVDINGSGVAWLYVGAGGGTVHLDLAVPLVVNAGQTCGYITQNNDSVARTQAVCMQVVTL